MDCSDWLSLEYRAYITAVLVVFSIFSTPSSYYFVFRRERDKRKRVRVLLAYLLASLFVKGCETMHFTLDGQAVFVYAPDTKDDLITLRQLVYDFFAYFAKHFAFVHTGKVVKEKNFAVVYSVRTSYVFVQYVRMEISW